MVAYSLGAYSLGAYSLEANNLVQRLDGRQPLACLWANVCYSLGAHSLGAYNLGAYSLGAACFKIGL
jgi:hypothetical protein